MRGKWRRFLSVALAMLMIFTTVPVNTFATNTGEEPTSAAAEFSEGDGSDIPEAGTIADEPEPEEETTTEAVNAIADPVYVAVVNGVSYSDLQSAINAGGEVVLLDSINLAGASLEIPAGTIVTLNLNGKTITGTPEEAKAYAVINNKGNLTITNGSVVCNHTLAGSTAYAVNTICNTGILVIDGANISNTSTATNQIGYAIDNNSTSANAVLTVSSGSVTASGSNYYDAVRQFCNSETCENTVTVNGGTVGSIWMQNPSDGGAGHNTKDVKGSMTITGNYVGAVYLEPSANFTAAIAESVNNVSAFDAEGYTLVKNADNTYSVVKEIVVPGLPTATVTEIANENLTFALNFKADAATAEQLAYYGDWYADFVLTINKDVTFNADGTADGYLSGQYDGWSENWVSVPFEDTSVAANTPFKIMEYAASFAGYSEPMTYAAVYEGVKDFNCGVFFNEVFLIENPDLEVSLELRMYNPADTSESYVIGQTYTFTNEVTAPALPTATVTEIENDDLTFALNFKADQATDEQLAYYCDWYADFVLTVNKDVTFNADGSADGYLAGQYDGWSENWVNVPIEDTSVAANTPFKIMEYAASLAGYSEPMTYAAVYEGVKDFDCGVFFNEVFLIENPDLVVTLELCMYNPVDTSESYVIGQTYTFTNEVTAPALPTATVTEIENDDLTFALNFKADAATAAQLAYYGDWYADFVLTVNKDVTFNEDGNADRYLSGQYYDGWSENWVNIPFENTSVAANAPFKIMEYVASLAGYSDPLVYAALFEGVKDFNCGVFFDNEFLAANSDLVVTLELRIYNPANTSESYVIGQTYEFTVENEVVIPALPTATVTEIENDDLTFAMNFKADDVTPEQLAYYGDWYADFELKVNQAVTFNADGSANGYLSGQYDAWSENWVDVPFENVTLNANEPLKIMAYAAETMGKPGLKYTYAEAYDVVKDFDCGVFFEPEFLLGLTEDLVVTLELKMYNNQDETENYTIGSTYTFEVPVAPAPPTATVTEIENDDLTFAMNFKADEVTPEQLAYYGDWYADFELTVNQEVTLNANGGADGYLSGQYDAWSENWVDVPFENVTLNANEPLKIMAYAAETMGKPGLKYTYREVYEAVKDFDCGVFFEPEFLLGLTEELVVTLELKMYNNHDESLNYTSGNTYTFRIPVAPELPTATATEIENDDLTFAMNFKADAVTPEQLAYYGDWYADFVLTVNKDVTLNADGTADGYLSGQYDAWSENWVNVPFENVTLSANESLKIMEYAAGLMGKPGLKYTYREVYETVKDFDCGMFFSPEYLAANPDLEVTLELRMYHPADEEINRLIGETYTFGNTYVAYNTVTKKLYTKVSDGVNEAVSGETVQVIRNTSDTVVNVLDGVTLDLNGYTLETNYVFSTGDVVDNSEDNAGLLKVGRIMLREDNAQLPVKTGEGYKFYEVLSFNEATVDALDENKNVIEDAVKYVFQPVFEAAAHADLLKGSAASEVSILVRVTWTRADDTIGTQDFVYGDTTVARVLGSYNAETGKYGRMFTLVLNNASNYNDLSYQVYVISKTTKVEFTVPETSGNTNGNVTTEVVTLSNEGATAVVPEGAKLDRNITELTLKIDDVEDSQSNIALAVDEIKTCVDVHIEGIAKDNTVPMKITLNQFVEVGLNEGNLALYHVEDGATNAMTQVFTEEEVDAHNEFYYNPATGDVTMALATFSEIAVVSDTTKPWDGKYDYSWYTDPEMVTQDENGNKVYTIANADQLAGFGHIVGGMVLDKSGMPLDENGNVIPDNFYGDTVNLISDINLNDAEESNSSDKIFYPIGYYNSEKSYKKVSGGSVVSNVSPFEGTFDGNGHTISNFYQNTWEMFGDYNDGYSGTPNHYKDAMGLFGYVLNGTVKNLTVNNFSSDGEYTPTGVIAAFAVNSTFENIAITNCNPRVYNTGNGGIIGIGGEKGDKDKTLTLKNITVDNSNKISALWGSWDVACGGLVGMFRGNADGGEGTIYFENCHVSAQIDVYNDVCANYQYYAYRYAGMMIGSIRHNDVTTDGKSVPNMTGISAKNCTVNFGTWNDYYYCELVANSLASYTHDHQFSRLEQVKEVNVENKTITYLGKTEPDAVPTSGRYNYVVVKTDADGKYQHGVNDAVTCYHFVNGGVWKHEDAGTETVNGKEVLKEDNKHIYLEFDQLFTGYGWGVNSYSIDELEGIKVEGINKDSITESDQDASRQKFATKFENSDKYLYRVGNQNAVSIGMLFKLADDVKDEEINDAGVYVTIDPVHEESNVSGTFTANISEWAKGKIQFSGTGLVKITIQDYEYSKPVSIYMEVVDAKNVTKYSELKNENSVLLTDITMSDGGSYYLSGNTLYGNGFTFDMTNGAYTGTSYLSSNYVFSLSSANLDNVKIIGAVYTAYGAAAADDYNRAAVLSSGNNTITNCYISNCASAVRVLGGNLEIINSTIKGGNFANIDIRGGHVVLDKVTTINQVNKNDTKNGTVVVGLGVVIYYENVLKTTTLEIKNGITQYNYLSESQAKTYITDYNAKNLVNTMFSNAYSTLQYNDGTNIWVNTGIISMTTDVAPENITGLNEEYSATDVTFMGENGYVYTKTPEDGAVTAVPNNYTTAGQGDIAPLYSFNYTNMNYKEKTDGSNDYCYEENGIVNLSMDAGDIFNWDTSILTVTKNGNALAYTVSMDGTDYTGKCIPFSTAGNYKVIYEYTDNNNYNIGADGTIATYSKTYKKTVDISVAVVGETAKHAEFTMGSNDAATEKITIDNITYISAVGVKADTDTWTYITINGQKIYYPIVAAKLTSTKGSKSYAYFPIFENVVTITDYDDNGTGEEIRYNSGTTSLPSGLTAVKGVYKPASDVTKWSDLKDGNLSYVGASKIFKWASSSDAPSTPKIYNKVLCYISPEVSADREEYITLVQYSYTDATNTIYYYYVGYTLAAFTHQSCVTPDTLITLADGSQKRIDEVTFEDKILAWDFFKGEYCEQDIALLVNHGEALYQVANLEFSDGTLLRLIAEHGVFDYDLNRYVYIDTDNMSNYIGHRFVKYAANGDYAIVTLERCYVTEEVTSAYSITSVGTSNAFASNMLTVAPPDDFYNWIEMGEKLCYDEIKFAEDVEKYGLYTYDVFADYVTYEQFIAFNGAYLRIPVEKGLFTFEYILELIELYISYMP